MSKEKIVMLLKAYREFTGDPRIANECGEAIAALEAELAKPEQEFTLDAIKQHLNQIDELEAKLSETYHRGRQDGIKQERALNEMSKISQELGAYGEQEPVAWVKVTKGSITGFSVKQVDETYQPVYLKSKK